MELSSRKRSDNANGNDDDEKQKDDYYTELKSEETQSKMELFRPRSKWVWSQMNYDKANGLSDDDIIHRLQNNEYGFNHVMFAKLKKSQQEQDDYISNPPEVEEGVVECHKCGSRRVFSVSIQTRAPDEPMSTKAHCMQCKYKWVQNS